jgi:hypothetical protein
LKGEEGPFSLWVLCGEKRRDLSDGGVFLIGLRRDLSQSSRLLNGNLLRRLLSRLTIEGKTNGHQKEVEGKGFFAKLLKTSK